MSNPYGLRVGAVIKSYHMTHFLPLVLEQLRWVDKIVVMNYRFKTACHASDDTKEICDEFGHSNLIVDSGSGLTQGEIHNKGMDSVRDCDLSWILDADEILLKKDQGVILERMADRTPKLGRPDFARCSFIDYKNDLYHASPKRPGGVTIIVDPKAVKFGRIREIENTICCADFPYINVHHMMTVFPPHVLSWKADWEYREEGIPKEKLLDNWKLSRDVDPPNELLELFKENKWQGNFQQS